MYISIKVQTWDIAFLVYYFSPSFSFSKNVFFCLVIGPTQLFLFPVDLHTKRSSQSKDWQTTILSFKKLTVTVKVWKLVVLENSDTCWSKCHIFCGPTKNIYMIWTNIEIRFQNYNLWYTLIDRFKIAALLSNQQTSWSKWIDSV